MSINKVILIGNVGQDPAVKSFEGGKRASFSLATSETYLGRNGEKVTQTEWHNIIVWRALADVVDKYVKKGSQIYVEGKITNRSWEDNDGTTRHSTEIVAETIRLLGSKQ